MNVLAEVWALVVKPNDVIWAAIFSVVGAIVAGLLGGWISGRLTRAAARDGAEQANRLNQEQQARETTAKAVAFVQAIQAEAEALWILVNQQIKPAVKAIVDNQGPVIAKFIIGDSYFSVYDANASMLGLVDDRDTRKNIVKTFIAARSFVDTIRQNNLLVERYEYMPHPPIYGGDPARNNEQALAKAGAKSELATFSNGVVFAWQELESKIGSFYESTNGWLSTKGAQANPPPQFIGP